MWSLTMERSILTLLSSYESTALLQTAAASLHQERWRLFQGGDMLQLCQLNLLGTMASGLLLMTCTTQGYIHGTFFTLLVNSNFIGCDSTSKLWNIKALAETHPERSECSCTVTIFFQGMFFCYMLPTSGCQSFTFHVGFIRIRCWNDWFSACDDCILDCEEESLIYTKRLSACVSTNPKPLKIAFMNTLNDVFMNMPSLSKWKYMLACLHTPLITTILCPSSVVACDGKVYV